MQRALHLYHLQLSGYRLDIHVMSLIDLTHRELGRILELGHEINTCPDTHIIGNHGTQIGRDTRRAYTSRQTIMPKNIIVVLGAQLTGGKSQDNQKTKVLFLHNE
jgi:hypothetical protein